MESKKPWLSKTLWINALIGVLAIAYPPASAWIVAHPEVATGIFAGINVVLRLITKDAISIAD